MNKLKLIKISNLVLLTATGIALGFFAAHLYGAFVGLGLGLVIGKLINTIFIRLHTNIQ